MSARYRDIFREIRKSFGRFLSILLIVAVGVGFYVGVKSTSPSMLNSAEDYFNRQSLMDIVVLSTVGFGDEDVEEIRKIEHVDKVMPSYSADLVTKSDGEARVAKVAALPGDNIDEINVAYIKEGRMPEAEDECLLTISELIECDLQLGDDIEFEPEAGGEQVDTILKHRKFHIVGIIELPQYISYTYGTASVGSGMITLAVMVPRSNFLYPRYTEVYLTLDSHRNGMTAFDDEYQPLVDEVGASLEELGITQYRAFISENQEQIKDAEMEYAEGKQDAEGQLDEAKDQLDDAKEQIDAGLKELQQGWIDYEAGSKEAQEQIANAEKQIAEYKQKIEDGEKKIASTEKDIENYRRLLEQYEPDPETEAAYEAALADVSAAQEKLNEAEEELSKAQEELDSIGSYADEIREIEEEIESLEDDLSSLDPGNPDDLGEIASIEAQIARLESELASLEARELALEGERAAAQSKVSAAELKVEAAQAELDLAETALAAAERDMEYMETYNSARERVEEEIADGEEKIEAGRKELEEGKRQLAEAEKELAQKKAEAEKELADAYDYLSDSEAELNKAQKQYDDSLFEYNEAAKEAEEKLSSGMNRIQNAKAELSEVISGKWYVLDRNTIMVGFSSYRSDAERIDTIANVFAVFFMLVAVLVCMSNMTRMVSEQRIDIGTYKALGYSKGKTAAKYLIYAALASAGGCILGPVVFIPMTPPTIFTAYDLVYMLPEFKVSASGSALALAISVAMISTITVAGFTCWKELKSSTAALMRPKAPPVGKKIILERIPFLWKHFSFFQKLTARNLFRYKMRLMMTVVGIAGCMALVVAGFGMRDAMVNITDIQYSEIEFEDMLISFDSNYTYNEIHKEAESIAKDERLKDSLLMLKEDCVVLNTARTESLADTYLYMANDTEQAGKLVDLHDPKTKEAVVWSDEGVIVTEKIARNMGADIGDEIVIRVGEGEYPVKIAGISECYIYNYVFMTPDYYKTVMNTEPVYNSMYASESDKMTDRSVFSTEWLEKSDKVVTVLYSDIIRKAVDDSMYGMEYIVIFMIVCAGVLACIVLYNLTNANISERMREIATVKVLGFNKWEVNMYVFRDNLIMSILGILVGAVVGWGLAMYLIKAVEVSMLTFIMSVAPRCYLYSAGITLTFTVLINLFMTKRLRAISMVESLKAVE